MNISVPQVTRTYRTSALWFLMDNEREQKLESYAYMNPKLPPVTAPFYRFAYEQFAETAAQGLAGILTAARAVKQTSSELLASTGSSSLDRRTVLSEDSGAVMGFAASQAKLQSLTIEVDQAAAAQVNTGTALPRSEPSVISAGTNRFSLTVGERTQSFSVDFWKGESNEQALSRIRRVLANAEMGVTAALVREPEDGTVKLQLKADTTGTTHAFSLKDEIGNIVEAAGLSQLERPAQNSIYRINGGSLTSSDENRVSLDQGRLTLAWTRSTEGPVELQVRPDAEAVVQQVNTLLKGYNQLIDAAGKVGSWLSPAAARAIERAIPENRKEALGISRHPDGYLELDKEELTSYVEGRYEEARQELTGVSGFGSQLRKLADKLLTAPSFALLNVQASPYTSLTNYQYNPIYAPPLQRYLPVPWIGTLMNDKF